MTRTISSHPTENFSCEPAKVLDSLSAVLEGASEPSTPAIEKGVWVYEINGEWIGKPRTAVYFSIRSEAKKVLDDYIQNQYRRNLASGSATMVAPARGPVAKFAVVIEGRVRLVEDRGVAVVESAESFHRDQALAKLTVEERRLLGL